MASRLRTILVASIALLALLAPLTAADAAAASQRLEVELPTPGGGTVTSRPAGISCETFFCNAEFEQGSPVSLVATPRTGFAFSGFSGDCLGPVCALTMDGPKKVTAQFVRFAVVTRSKLQRNRADGSALLAVRVGGPGGLALAGGAVRRQTAAPPAASNVRLRVVARGAAARMLRLRGSAKVTVTVSFTPAEGTLTSFRRSLLLLRRR
jgi:hypothetical protein